MRSKKLKRIFSLNKIKNFFIKRNKKNEIEFSPRISRNIKLRIKGENNKIIIKSTKLKGDIIINIYGNNNNVIIDENVNVTHQLNITIGMKTSISGEVTNSNFIVKKDTTIEGVEYSTYNSNSFCNIGENCMISSNVILYNSDGHPILDKETNEVINKVKGIEIGDHCWIGMYSSILKNSVLPNNSILGFKAVYATHKYTQEYCSYAGNPAKLIKENVTWERNGMQYGYIDNN